MSREVDYTKAADWSDEEAAENYAYLDTRGRLWELEQAKALRGEVGTETPPAEGDSGNESVPDGTVQDVLDWVGDDQARARKAFDAEEGKEEPRSTLLAALESLI